MIPFLIAIIVYLAAKVVLDLIMYGTLAAKFTNSECDDQQVLCGALTVCTTFVSIIFLGVAIRMLLFQTIWS